VAETAKKRNEETTQGTIANGRQSLIVEARVRDTLNNGEFAGMRLDGEFIGAASAKVEDLIRAAAVRAKANGRNTLRPSDL
jgi:hypothetical protein